jgi:branched-chain amino acid transport system substrate-binding protein
VTRWTSLGAASKTSVTRALATALLAGAAGLVALGGLTACGGADHAPAKSAPDPIHIGAIYDTTGSQASLDTPSLNGARLAVDRINAAGGLLGRRIELLERDGQTNVDIVRLDARNLAAQHVTAMIGLSDSDQVLAAAPVAAAASIPFVTSGATSPLLPHQVPDWLFLACFGDNEQAAAGAEYAITEMGTRRVAVLYDKDLEYTRLLEHYFVDAFKAYGGTVVFAHAFSTGDGNVAKLMSRTQDGDADDSAARPVGVHLIYVAAAPQDAAALVKRLRRAGYGQPIMGGDSFDNQKLVAAGETTGGGVYFTTHAALGLPRSTPAMRRFSARYAAAYGRTPENAFAALGYDTVDLVAKAIRRAKSADPIKVRDELLKMRAFNGVTGPMSYAGDTFVPQKAVTIVSVGRVAQLAAQVTPIYVPQP